jgi:hypothetical protein
MFGCKSKFYGQIISSQKKVLCFCKCEINSINKVTYVRIVEIEEASPPLEEDIGDLIGLSPSPLEEIEEIEETLAPLDMHKFQITQM